MLTRSTLAIQLKIALKVNALSYLPTLRLTDIAVKVKSRCTWAVILIFLTFARSMRGNNFISKYFVESLFSFCLTHCWKKARLLLQLNNSLPSLKYYYLTFSYQFWIRAQQILGSSIVATMRQNPRWNQILVSCWSVQTMTTWLFFSHTGAYDRIGSKFGLGKAAAEIIDCTERKDIVNRYKMPKYLFRFVITFWIKNNFAFFQGQFSYTKSAFRPT